MARPVHQIATLEFPILRGVVAPYKQMVEVIERKGTSDLLRRATGFQSPMFNLESMLNLASFAVAQAQIESYTDTIEAGALTLIKDDYDYTQDGILIVVIDVSPTLEEQRAQIAGGFGGANDNFELRCRWQLRFVTL